MGLFIVPLVILELLFAPITIPIEFAINLFEGFSKDFDFKRLFSF